MIKRKRTGKTLDEIGKRWHNFDFKSEKIIYYYLCCKQIKKKELQNLNDDLKFVEYRQWKHYICDRYQNCSKDKLIEFSRYLNLLISDIKPSHEYWSIMATAFLSMVFTNVINFFIEIYTDFSNNSVWIVLPITMLIEFFITIFLIYSIIEIMNPIYDNHFDENFLRDYKEIIDDIIKGRKSE